MKDKKRRREIDVERGKKGANTKKGTEWGMNEKKEVDKHVEKERTFQNIIVQVGGSNRKKENVRKIQRQKENDSIAEGSR